MTICKYRCKNCGRLFYTDSLKIEPECNCNLFGSDVAWLWLTDRPTKKELHEAYSNGYYRNLKKEAMIFNKAVIK